jgi:hypothetical protein
MRALGRGMPQRLRSKAAAQPLPQPARLPTASIHPAVDPVSDSPEHPTAKEQERAGCEGEQNWTQDETEHHQNKPQDESDDRLQ